MARCISIDIGTRRFRSKKDAVKYFQGILYRHKIGSSIPEPDHSDLCNLLQKHTEADKKIGAGIDYFEVRSALYNQRCFYVVRVDGSSTDFSMHNCIDGRENPLKTQIYGAFRAAVQSDILDKKRQWFSEHGVNGVFRCPINGVEMKFETSHADHAPPMTLQVLVTTFLAAKKIDLDARLLLPNSDNQLSPKLADQNLESSWIEYHHSVANIRVISAQANLSSNHAGRIRMGHRQLKLI